LCKACGHEFEREQRISDAPIKKCPSCGALKARRQISRTSFVLKGGGWYSDLYATPSGAKKEDKAAGGESKPAAESSAEAAPAPAKGDGGGGGGDSPGKGPKKGGGKGGKGGKGAKAAA